MYYIMLTERLKAVSYTHLDVYKRQVLATMLSHRQPTYHLLTHFVGTKNEYIIIIVIFLAAHTNVHFPFSFYTWINYSLRYTTHDT